MCSAAQTCTTTKTTIESLNIEAGGCKTAETDEQSKETVVIHAINDPNTQVDERTFCNFQCQLGYFEKTIGDRIPFKCVPNATRTEPLGITQTAPIGCQGECEIFVLPFSIALYLGLVEYVSP